MSKSISIEQFKTLPLGTVIKWKSPSRRRIHSGGASSCFTDKHEGIFRGFIPAWTKPTEVYPALAEITSSQCQFGNGRTGTSVNDRVLVEVVRTGSNGQQLKSKWYAPRASAVIEIEGLGHG